MSTFPTKSHHFPRSQFSQKVIFPGKLPFPRSRFPRKPCQEVTFLRKASVISKYPWYSKIREIPQSVRSRCPLSRISLEVEIRQSIKSNNPWNPTILEIQLSVKSNNPWNPEIQIDDMSTKIYSNFVDLNLFFNVYFEFDEFILIMMNLF